MQEKLHILRDGNQLCYEMARFSRSESTLVFLNGSFFSRRQWDLLVSRLQLKMRSNDKYMDLLLMDYRGFGNARPLEGKFSIYDVQDDVLEIIDAEQICGEVDLVGCSLGSMVGFSLLNRFPEKFSKLYAYGFIPPVDALIRHVINIFIEIKASLNGEGGFFDKMNARIDKQTIHPFAKVMWDIFVVNYSRSPESLKARGYTESYGVYILRYMKGTPVASIASFLDSFTDPALIDDANGMTINHNVLEKITVFQGEDDMITPYEMVLEYCHSFPATKLVSFKKKGHTDIFLDGHVCDVIASTIVGR
ncbi:MAG TPA: alpha/beta hydrolase [Candidatus Lokiarchaeia archaeon]|nr:alpha/beta hydrolase [Candidatus Lokiarchaeia archaeon]